VSIVIGITGTREGATPAQLDELRSHIAQIYAHNGVNATVLHHGDCVGVDEQAHDIAREYDMLIEVHPSDERGSPSLHHWLEQASQAPTLPTSQ
jgi:hypothetical protein